MHAPGCQGSHRHRPQVFGRRKLGTGTGSFFFRFPCPVPRLWSGVPTLALMLAQLLGADRASSFCSQEYFERALELPGTGLKRWRDKPPALSTGELTVRALVMSNCCREPVCLRSCVSAGAGLPTATPADAARMQAALYNIACCRSRLGDIDNGLVALAGCVEQGE